MNCTIRSGKMVPDDVEIHLKQVFQQGQWIGNVESAAALRRLVLSNGTAEEEDKHEPLPTGNDDKLQIGIVLQL